MDFELRDALRKTLTGQEDPIEEFRYRSLCLREGRVDLLVMQPGDTLRVEEAEYPWIHGAWEGVVIKIGEGGDGYVKPLIRQQDYRVTPSQDYFDRGLYLTRADMGNSRIIKVRNP